MPDEEQPTLGQDQTATETTPVQTEAPAPAPAPVQGGGPWDNDLSSLFEDEGTRSQVSDFLRQKVQPYVTQLEQSRSTIQAAEQLYADLLDDPAATYIAISQELFGADGAEQIRGVLSSFIDDDDDDEPDTPADTSRDPDVESVVKWFKEKNAKEAYDSELKRIQDQDSSVNRDLFHPFVVAAEGDFDAAYQGYKNWYSQAQSSFTPPPPAAEQAPPPPAIGSDVTPGTAPPVQKTYGSMDEAIDDFMREVSPGAPTTVGSV
jgi:hypothetical protein